MMKTPINLVNDNGETILELLARQGYTLSCCGGNGICGRCKVRFLEGATLPSMADRKVFNPDELRAGYRLACLSKPKGEYTVEVHFAEDKEIEVVTQNLLPKKNADEDADAGDYFIAVDLGTTTIAMQAIAEKTGKVVGTYGVLNPQRKFGKDVIARIQAGNAGKLSALKEAVIQALVEGITYLQKEGLSFEKMIIAGNTTMVHLLMGYSVEGLGRYPFQPETLDFIETKIQNIKTFLLPGISAFVGGDVVSGIYQLGIHKAEKKMLLVDLGTNGEIVVGDKNRLVVTATAAGPAFEGGPLAGIVGSDMITLVSTMLKDKVIDTTGKLEECYGEDGYPIEGVRITQKDIRDLQLAKAAIRTGIDALLARCQISYEEIEQVYLAGGFGYYLNVEDAKRIGLLPKELIGKVKAVGNTSLGGAILLGQKEEIKEELSPILEKAEDINLATLEDFGEKYLETLNFSV